MTASSRTTRRTQSDGDGGPSVIQSVFRGTVAKTRRIVIGSGCFFRIRWSQNRMLSAAAKTFLWLILMAATCIGEFSENMNFFFVESNYSLGQKRCGRGFVNFQFE